MNDQRPQAVEDHELTEIKGENYEKIMCVKLSKKSRREGVPTDIGGEPSKGRSGEQGCPMSHKNERRETESQRP